METNSLLKKLISISSVYPHEEEISRFLTSHLGSLGFSVSHVPTQKTRSNIIATNLRAKKYLGFYGHMDTVPPDAAYIDNPFRMRIERNHIARGLGVCDMKGGIAAILQTAQFAAQNKMPVKIIFGVDEEDISRGAHDLIDSKFLSDITFLIVAESGQVKDIRQDFSMCYGRKGHVFLEVMIQGKTAHAAESIKGVNAIEKAAKLIGKLQTLRFPKDRYLGVTDVVVRGIQTHVSGFSVPDSCVIGISFLTTPLVTYDFLKEKVKVLTQKERIRISFNKPQRETPFGQGYTINRTDPFLKLISRQIFSRHRVTPLYTPSVADENVFANRLRIPVLTLGPIGGGDHTASEWMNLSSLAKVETVFREILTSWHSSSRNGSD